jgi:hypothetical protein
MLVEGHSEVNILEKTLTDVPLIKGTTRRPQAAKIGCLVLEAVDDRKMDLVRKKGERGR